MQFYVKYFVMDAWHEAGPYRTLEEADQHAADIRGYEGVSGTHVDPRRAPVKMAPEEET